ncbi:uncharacterized protein FOMMEDRAFT_156215 [Fomitiporia mediterranea MF3/22]|uniref:uncharacterized protein n=1 Tax=Fomitiporia mediterranea (strain MF3/22) TaxID=694068 RepID=UPI000440839D|nr:uncharacterized protein FOMMEDRAFT_156215 [Fomitiporia mediterranea MF3/22]EJD02858.1 hypothetical protein FOMMEDRAFT_156215 [Fomitiporia mediterranea MF3/22]
MLPLSGGSERRVLDEAVQVDDDDDDEGVSHYRHRCNWNWNKSTEQQISIFPALVNIAEWPTLKHPRNTKVLACIRERQEGRQAPEFGETNFVQSNRNYCSRTSDRRASGSNIDTSPSPSAHPSFLSNLRLHLRHLVAPTRDPMTGKSREKHSAKTCEGKVFASRKKGNAGGSSKRICFCRRPDAMTPRQSALIN